MFYSLSVSISVFFILFQFVWWWVVSGHQVTLKARVTKSGCQFTPGWHAWPGLSRKSCEVCQLIVFLLIKSGKRITKSAVFMLNRKS